MKRNVLRLTIVVALAAFMLAAALPSSAREKPKQPPTKKFVGVPRDIDYSKLNKEGTQVIISPRPPMDDLISFTKNGRIESILLVALMLKNEVTVDYVAGTPNTLTSVRLSVKAKLEQGQVLSLSFNEGDNKCQASIFDQENTVNVFTYDVRMQSILEAAVRQSIPVQEFAYDKKTMEITRGKVNVTLR